LRAWLLSIGLFLPAALALAAPIGPFAEDDGSIPLASETGLVAGAMVEASGTIGDGPFGSGGTGSGDFDFYRIPGVLAGQTIIVDIDTTYPYWDLDPHIVLYDSAGIVFAFNEDFDGSSWDSYLSLTALKADDYFLSIGAYGSTSLTDPMDSSSGPGVGSEGTYDVSIELGLVSGECPGGVHVLWPSADPVWDFCYQRPQDTTSLQNGAGLRIFDVKYKGVLVLSDGSIPVLNVQYDEGGCGGANLCYRDWFDQEIEFLCTPESPAGQCSGATTPVQTVCGNPGSDVGSFDGVAVEDLGTSLMLTSQAQASWYRYIPTWEFFPDGTLQPGMDISSVDSACVAFAHRHHAYFRLDFDLDGPEGDSVTQLTPGNPTPITTERTFVDIGSDRPSWLIESAGSTTRIEVTRNAWDGATDPFSVADAWLLAYKPGEIDDGPHSKSECPIDLNDYLNDESVQNADIVLWVHSATDHEGEPGGIAQDCSTFGPTLKVIMAIEEGTLEAPATSDWDRALLVLLLMTASIPLLAQWRRARA